MGYNNISITIDAQMEVGKIKSSVEQIKNTLSSLYLPKDIGAEFEKRLERMQEELRNFQNLSSKMGDSLDGAKKIDASYKKILDYARQIENSLAKTKEQAGVDPSKFFPKDIVSKIEKANDSVKKYNSSLKEGEKSLKNQISSLNNLSKTLSSKTTDLETSEAKQSTSKKVLEEAKEIEAITKQASSAAVQQATKEKQAIQTKISSLENEKTALKNVEKAQKELIDAEDKLQRFQNNSNSTRFVAGQEQEVERLRGKLEQATESAKKYNSSFSSSSEVTAEIKRQEEALRQQTNIISQAAKENERASLATQKAQEAYNEQTNLVKTNATVVDTLKQRYQELSSTLEQSRADIAANAMKQLAASLREIGIEVDPTKQSFEEIQSVINGLKGTALVQLSDALKQVQKNVDEVNRQITQLGNKNQVYQNMTEDIRQANQELEQVKNRIQYFFSLTNGAMLFRRVLQQAVESIKELDAAMTETAVVTDFDVGDMWEALPEYTETANKLGATTLGAYETMTLFYQQGLKTNEVFEIGTETMKMARIAGLEYSDTTDLMTAALRGFNMELNATSATRINDVYSELAAITAADTEEIATAMTKTASIAENANMEFETTAAFLSQIIETTREPAETAGTAMKTIIARFTEMKKATSDIIDVDGEEVSVNKVEAALKSAGVALRDVNGEFRDLDDVFLELASKWDSLDLMTQRYVATMAAGSRQQSRFIAMMSDYDRTIELIDASYDSAGASSMQFAKTLDSMEAKINELENAWQEFLLGLTNSDAAKALISTLTLLLNILNDLTAGANSWSSSFLKLFTVIAGFKGVKTIFNTLIASVGTAFLKGGTQAGLNFNNGLRNTLGRIKSNFPFFGTFKKELRQLSKEIKTVSNQGAVDLRKLSFANVQGSQTGIVLSDTIGSSVEAQLMSQLEAVGDLTPEGQQWAQELIKGFLEGIRTGKYSIVQGMELLEQSVREGILVDVESPLGSPENPIISQNVNPNYFTGTTNLKNAKKVTTEGMTVKTDELKKATQQTNDWAMAMMSLGMITSALGANLEELGGTAGKFGTGLTIMGDAASTGGMALMSVASIANALGHTLSTGPLVAITAIVTVISLVINAVNKAKEAVKEAQQTAIDAASTLNEEVEANRDLLKTLEETIDGYQEGTSSREEVVEASQELIEKYGLESERARLLTGDYEALAAAIRDKVKAEEEANIKAQQEGISATRAQLITNDISKVASLDTGGTTIDEVDISKDDFEIDADELLENLMLDKYISIGTSGTLNFDKAISEFTNEELVNLSKFLSQYLTLLGNTLTAQGIEPTDSEVYMQLSEIVANTSDNFSTLNEQVSAASESLANLAGIIYEEDLENNPEEISSREEYQKERSEFEGILRTQKPDITDEEVKKQADTYFSQFSSTSGYVGAEEIILQLKAEYKNASDDAWDAFEIYNKYINGEISGEAFVKFFGDIEIDANVNGSLEDINNLVESNRVKTAIEAPGEITEGFQGISDYINENFTLEGIDEEELQNFEAYLAVVNDTLPDSINLLDDWEKALQKGTLGVSQFVVDLQTILSTQSLQLQQATLNQTAFGIAATNEQIQSNYNEWKNLSDDKRNKAVQEKYGNSITWDTFESIATGDYTELLAQAEAELNAAKEKRDQYSEEYLTSEYLTQYHSVMGPNALVKYTEDGQVKIPTVETIDDLESVDLDSVKKYKDIKELSDLITELDTVQNEPNPHVNKSGLGIKSAARYASAEKSRKKKEKEISEQIEAKKTELQFEGEVDSAKLANEVNNALELAKEQANKELEIALTPEINVEELDKEVEEAENKFTALKEGEAIQQQIDINLAVNNAQALITLQNQIQQIKTLTEDGLQVDASTFEQLVAITPEIAAGAEVAADGTINISKGMELLNEQLAKEIGLKEQSTKETLTQALADENAYQEKLQRAIDAIEAELAMNEASAEVQGETNEAITALAGEEAYKRAKLADQEAQDTSDAAKLGAENTINSVSAMQNAYIELGKTLDDIHEKMVSLPEKEKYAADALENTVSSITINTVTDDGATEEEYTTDYLNGLIEKTEDWDPKKRKEQLNSMLSYLKEQRSASVARGGTYTSLLSGMLGGGQTDDEDGSDSDSDKAEEKLKNEIELLNAQAKKNALKEKEEAIEKRLKNLQKQKIRDYDEEAKLLEEQVKAKADYIDILAVEAGFQEAVREDYLKELDKEFSKYVKYDKENEIVTYTEAYLEIEDAELQSSVDEFVDKFNNLSGELNATNVEIEAEEVEFEEILEDYISKNTIAQELERHELEKQAKYLGKYYNYDAEKEDYILIQEKYDELPEEEKKALDEEYRKLQDINKAINQGVEELRNKEFKTSDLEEQYYEGYYGSQNIQSDLELIERKRNYNEEEKSLVGKLPEEIQQPLNLVLLGNDIKFEAEEITKRKEDLSYIEQQIAAKEANDQFSAFYTYDSETNTYKIEEEKIANAKISEEDRKEIENSIKELNDLRKSQSALQDELYGGFVQSSIKNFGKVLDGAADAAKGDEKASEKLDKAFDELEKQLGLDEDALDDFAKKIKEAAESSEFMEKEFKGFGIEGIEEKLAETSFNDETKAGLSKILGKGTFTGADFTDAMGGVLTHISDYLNFDMLGLGLDFFNQIKGLFDSGKEIFENIKSKVEELIGYITQATQVLVDAWTNREDRLYNFLQIVERELREYEKLQRYSTQIEKGRITSVQDIADNWNKQWESLQTQLEEQQFRLDQREQQLTMSRLNPFSLISGWDPTSDTLYENRTIKLIWDAAIGAASAFLPMGLGAFADQLNQLYEDYDSRVQEAYEDRIAAEEAIAQIEEERLDLVKLGAEEATEFEQQVLDALIQKEQEQIDELSRLNEAVTDANSKLISTLENNLSKIREQRENEKTEEELSEKQRRLSYLRQDTSGANMLEIKKLEEELEEGHEDYTDTLIDQKISELQEQNDKAAEQRQQQIDLLQSQLDWAQKYGLYWDAIYGMLYTFDENGVPILNPENFDVDGNIRSNSELSQLLGTFTDTIGMSLWSQVLQNEELDRLAKYYGFFIGQNGVLGQWAKYFALEDPSGDDPEYAVESYSEEDFEGFFGFFRKIEVALKELAQMNDPGLFNGWNRLVAFFSGEEAEEVNPAYTNATVTDGLEELGKKIQSGWNDLIAVFERGNKTTKSVSNLNRSSQSNGIFNETFNFNIEGLVSDTNLDDLTDKIASVLRNMFNPTNNVLSRSK